jgi:chromosome segregation ATPase
LTAGRKPPKITSKVKDQKEEPGMQAAPAPTAAMLISEGVDDADDDMFVTDEVQQQMPPTEMLNAGGDQGKLVRELLEAKKEQAQAAVPDDPSMQETKDEKTGIRMGKLKRKKDDSNLRYSEVDIDKLSTMTQQLCQTVNPLGKSVDLIYQDIASMSKELDQWRAEYRSATERQQVEREQTEKQLAPLHQKVAAIDDQIADMNSKVAGIRSRIQNNDNTIQQLLETIAYPGS